MNKEQAKELATDLSPAWLNKTNMLVKEKTETQNMYYAYFLPKEYEHMKMTFDVLKLKKQYLPSIAEFNSEYLTHVPVKKQYKSDEINCYACNDFGYALIDIKGYQYVLYCDLCEKGGFEAGLYYYDKYGTKNRSKREKPQTAPISQYIDVNRLMEENRKQNRKVEVYYREKKLEMTEDISELVSVQSKLPVEVKDFLKTFYKKAGGEK